MIKKFTIEVEMEEDWIDPFMSALKLMEYLGDVGEGRVVGIFSDGQGTFHPKFHTMQDYNVVPPFHEDGEGNCVYDLEE